MIGTCSYKGLAVEAAASDAGAVHQHIVGAHVLQVADVAASQVGSATIAEGHDLSKIEGFFFS